MRHHHHSSKILLTRDCSVRFENPKGKKTYKWKRFLRDGRLKTELEVLGFCCSFQRSLSYNLVNVKLKKMKKKQRLGRREEI